MSFLNSKVALVALIVGAAIVTGVWRYQVSEPNVNQGHIAFYDGQSVSFKAKLIDYPDVRVNHVAYEAQAIELNGSPVEGKVRITSSLYPRFGYGDVVLANCKLEAPKPFEDFAYDRYLATKSIYIICPFADLSLIERIKSPIVELYVFKDKVQKIIQYNIAEPHASIISAMVLGEKGEIPRELLDKFGKAGIAHMLAISGMHIAILFGLGLEFGYLLGVTKRTALLLMMALICVYVAIIGFPASAIRAAVMVGLAGLAFLLSRPYQSANALLLAASIMAFINPKIIRDDIGFQFSFAAVAGIIYITPSLKNIFNRFNSFEILNSLLAVTLAAQLTTTPLTFYYFGYVSLVAPLANALVVPLLPVLMSAIFLAIGVSLLLPPAAFYLFFLPYALLWLIEVITDLILQLPFSSITL